MPKIDRDAIPFVSRTGYPPPFDVAVEKRFYQRLTGPAGLTRFGVNICRLEPGAWSSQRHWHSKADEFLILLSGEAVLVTDAGEEPMRPGDCASFPAGLEDGHHLVNRSGADATFLVVGTNHDDDHCTYPDIDLDLPRAGGPYVSKAGVPY
jgi:uncharacterized cupin superfamily protein